MSPEYGATCGFFPVDQVTIDYLKLTGRSPERIALTEAYCKENMKWKFRALRGIFTSRRGKYWSRSLSWSGTSSGGRFSQT